MGGYYFTFLGKKIQSDNTISLALVAVNAGREVVALAELPQNGPASS